MPPTSRKEAVAMKKFMLLVPM